MPSSVKTLTVLTTRLPTCCSSAARTHERSFATRSMPGAARRTPSLYDGKKASIPPERNGCGAAGNAAKASGRRNASRSADTCEYPTSGSMTGTHSALPPCARQLHSTRQAEPVPSTITSECVAPLRMPSASRTRRVYAMSSGTPGALTSSGRCPKYTNGAPLAARLSYSQTATHLWSPSRETQSTMYSAPTRNSWTSTEALR
mmetsp:Transcript_6267/g.19608  ORF Transcript_6267/g.19608 Transcript_6267/m.19608 type:complete len:203 (+) Transcript_6267:431-1039(+)